MLSSFLSTCDLYSTTLEKDLESIGCCSFSGKNICHHVTKKTLLVNTKNEVVKIIFLLIVIGAYESREAHSHKRPHELSPCLMLWGFNLGGFWKAGVSRHFEENDGRLKTRFFQDRCGSNRYVRVLHRTRSPELMTVGIAFR